MRFKLTLQVIPGSNLLPLNYQYELSAWIYKIINLGDASFSSWLHNQGYLAQGKHYKLFTFSRLHIPQFKITQDRLQVISTTISLTLSFYTPISAETFITGLFRQQKFTLGDSQSKVTFEVSNIAAEPLPAFRSKSRFRLVSPVCVSTVKNQDDKRMPLYLSPEDVAFTGIFRQNLLHKYAASPVVPATDKPVFLPESILFKLLSKPASKLVTIKANTPQQTKVRGYLFDFEIEAPATLLEVGYFAGWGEKNSLGFGCGELLI